MNKQFVDALAAARRDGYIAAMQDVHSKLFASQAWAEAIESDDQYHRGLRDGIVRALEAIGLDRWKTKTDTKSGR